MKQINVKLLAILAVTGLVLLVGTKLLHDYQEVKGAGMMLVQAEKAKESGEYEDAAKLLQGYLARRPDDIEQYSNLALTMKQALESARESGRVIDAKVFQRTYGTIELALRKAPDDVELRKAAVDFAFQFRRWPDAISHIEYLTDTNAGEFDPELAMKLAQCQLFSGQEELALQTVAKIVGFDTVERKFDAENAQAPEHVDAYSFLSNIYSQRKSRPEIAMAVLERMVTANGNTARAYLSRASSLRTGTDEEKAIARKDIAKALELTPDDPDTLVLAGRFALDTQDFTRAKELYERVLAIDPKNVQALLGMSLWGGATRDVEAAITYLTRAEEVQPRNPTIILQKANMEIDRGNFDKVDEAIRKLEALNFPRPYREFLQGRVHLQRGEWLRAADKMTNARPHIVQQRPEWLTPIDSALALCYENLSQHDKRLEVFQQILMRDPGNMMARWGKIEALRAMKQTDRALTEYEKLERQFGVQESTAGQLLVPHLTLELLQQRNRAEESRDFTEAESLVRRILQETRINDAAKASVVAQFYKETGNEEKARAVLDRARSKDPNNLPLQLEKISELAKTDIPGAYKALDEFQKRNGDMASIRMLRARIIMTERKDGYEQELRKQAENVSMFPENERLRIAANIGRMLIAAGDTKGAKELWQRVADSQPDNLQIRIGIFELSLQEGDAAGQNVAMNQLRSLVGDSSAEMKWAQAMEVLWAVKREERPTSDLSEARGLIDDAISIRPGWEALYRISGELALRTNETEKAMAAFEKAAELGAVNLEVFRNLAVLSFSSQRYTKARQYLDQLPRYMWSSREQRMDMELLARKGELPADMPINEDSQDPQDHYFAGRVLASAKRLEEADAAFRRALQLEPENPEFWGGLFNLYADNDQLEAASKILRTAEMKLSEANAPMFLGTAYRKLENWEMSEANYKTAAEMQPDNAKILNAMAEMLLVSKQYDKARTCLEKMIALPPKPEDASRLGSARRRLAGLIASAGTYDSYQEAIELLKKNQGDVPTMSTQDLVLYGQLALGRSDSLSRRQAIEVFESTAQRRSLVFQERFQLASLYERDGRWSDCKSEMESLLATTEDNTVLLEPWLNWLVKHDELDKAATWLRKAPQESAIAVRTKAHIDVSRGQVKRAVDALVRLVPKEYSPETAQQYAFAASLAEDLALKDDRIYAVADKVWSRFAQGDSKNLIGYARYLGRREDGPILVQALKVCDQVRKSGNSIAAVQIAASILRKEACPERTKYGNAVRGWSDAAIDANPDQSIHYVVRSELEDILGDSNGAADWLRKFIDLGRGSVQERGIVANNLAFKLALSGDGAGAIKLAEQSMKLLGPQDALKDTFGMAYLAAEDYSRAITEFEAAIIASPSASKNYHLAVAKWRSGDRDGGAEALELAIEMGLQDELGDGPEADKAAAFIKELQSAGAIATDPTESDLEESASTLPATLRK
jgi:tetratricopeptide (TPR) repeat protein